MRVLHPIWEPAVLDIWSEFSPCWKLTVTAQDNYFIWLYIVLAGSVSHRNSSCWFPPLCIFDQYSFIFCEAVMGKLRCSMIYDISSQRRMKNKLDFPKSFPDQPLTKSSFPLILPHLPESETCDNSETNMEQVFILKALQQFYIKIECIIFLQQARGEGLWKV